MLSTYSSAPSTLSEKGLVQGNSFAYSGERNGRIVLGCTEIALGATGADATRQQMATIISRSLLVTSTGALEMWFAGGTSPVWSRQEALGLIDNSRAVAWLDLSNSTQTSAVAATRHSTIQRWQFHIERIQAFISRLYWLKLASRLKATQAESASQDWLTKAFGFRKVAVVGSSVGKVFGVDVLGGGQLLWDRLVVDLRDGEKMEWKKLVVSQPSFTSSGVVAGVAEVASAGVRLRKVQHSRYSRILSQGRAAGILFRLDAATGTPIADTLQLFTGPVLAAFSLPPSAGGISANIGVVDSKHNVIKSFS